MTTHRIVAIGDAHLQSTNPRNADRLAALDFIIDQNIEAPNLGAWALLGDVFHSRSSIDDRNALATRLVRMAAAAPVVIVQGNHELPGDLDVFGRLAGRYVIHAVTTPQLIALPLATGAVAAVAVLPYPTKGGLVAAGTVAGETLQAGYDALTDVFRGLAADLRDTVADVALFLGHINVAGAIASNGQPQIGRELEASRDQLALLGDCVKLLGHIHHPQQFDRERAYYCGSIARLDYGEVEEKRYLTIEFSDDEDLVPAVRSHPLPVAPMYRIEGELTRDGFTYQTPDGDPVFWGGCEVRVRYRFGASERNVLDHSLVRVPFADALRLDVEPVAVPDRSLRAPEVAAAVTLAEKVQAWAKASGATVTSGVLDKLALLEHGDASHTHSAVANQIAALEQPAEKAKVAA